MLKSKYKGPKEATGWQGNIFYPDGPDGSGFGIEVLPDGRVWFPMLKADQEPTPNIYPETSQPLQEPVSIPKGIHLPIPLPNVTDNSCIICGKSVPGKRVDRKYCSARCRKVASRGKQLTLAGVEL